MVLPNYQPVASADPENFRLSSLDEDKRTTKLLEHTDEEAAQSEDGLPHSQEKAKPKAGGITMLFWILVNTFATIGIVSIVDHMPTCFKLTV